MMVIFIVIMYCLCLYDPLALSAKLRPTKFLPSLFPFCLSWLCVRINNKIAKQSV